MILAEYEIERYNQPPDGIIALLIHVGQTLYNRLRNIIVSGFSFTRRNTGGAGDITEAVGEKRSSWISRVSRYLCSSIVGSGSTSSTTESEEYEHGDSKDQVIQPSASTTVTIGSSLPSGTDLYERESDIEYFYPDPAFVLDGPPSDTEANIVHISISQNID